MNKKYLFICVLIFMTSYIRGQEIDSLPPYLKMYQKVAFVTSDSVIDFTRYNEENGDFYFSRGTLDSSSLVIKTLFYLEKKQMKKRMLEYTEAHHYTDTLKNYFPVIDINYDKHSKINIINEVRFSHILNKIGEEKISNSSTRNIVRFVYPCIEMNSCNSYYLVKMMFFEDSVKLYSIFGQANDFSDLQVIHKDSCFLKNSEIKKIEKLLNKIEKPYHECSSPGNPWLIESNFSGNYKRHIISYDCCQRSDKDLEPIVNLYLLLRSINRKYFGNNCPR